MEQSQTVDWSELFPEISGCERMIQPLTRSGEVIEQIAVYNREDDKNYKCGAIILRIAPKSRQSAAKIYKTFGFSLFKRKITVKDFVAYTASPQCGNDDWQGSTTVYFDEDKSLIVSAQRGTNRILEFPETADYALMKKSMDELVKNKTK
jgi:hypothetical protein